MEVTHGPVIFGTNANLYDQEKTTMKKNTERMDVEL